MAIDSIRTVQAISSPGIGGREILAPVLARQLSASGHPAWLLCRPETLVERLGHEMDLPVVPTNMHGYFDGKSILAIARFLRETHIRIIHAHWSRDLSNLLLAARLAGRIPVVLTKHVYSTERKRDLFHDWIYRQVAAVIAVSEVVAANVADTTCTPKRKITTIYNGIDLQTRWNPAQVEKADLQRELGLSAQTLLLGYAGRLNEGKGPHLLIAAWRLLAAEFPNWHLVLSGEAVGEQEQDYVAGLRRRLAAEKLESRVHFIGFRPDMPAVMRAMEVVVAPSRFESLGMVLVEAMAMERPVIGSDTGGILEIIQPGANGEFFRYGEPEDLAKKLRPLLADPALRLRLGKKGRQIAEEKFCLEGSTRKVIALYQKILANE